MQVNICHRLIKNMIEHGHAFISLHNCIRATEIPLGVYATKSYAPGDIVHHLSGSVRLAPTRESIHIGFNMHVVDEFGQYINHSFDPNTRIDMNRVIAIKHIQPYDEITFNYNVSEINMASPFVVDDIAVKGIDVKGIDVKGIDVKGTKLDVTVSDA